jgi:hypothetical protein
MTKRTESKPGPGFGTSPTDRKWIDIHLGNEFTSSRDRESFWPRQIKFSFELLTVLFQEFFASPILPLDG